MESVEKVEKALNEIGEDVTWGNRKFVRGKDLSITAHEYEDNKKVCKEFVIKYTLIK